MKIKTKKLLDIINEEVDAVLSKKKYSDIYLTIITNVLKYNSDDTVSTSGAARVVLREYAGEQRTFQAYVVPGIKGCKGWGPIQYTDITAVDAALASCRGLDNFVSKPKPGEKTKPGVLDSHRAIKTAITSAVGQRELAKQSNRTPDIPSWAKNLPSPSD